MTIVSNHRVVLDIRLRGESETDIQRALDHIRYRIGLNLPMRQFRVGIEPVHILDREVTIEEIK